MKQQKANSLPLTQSQMSLWTGQRMHPDSPLHNVVYTFAISGPLNVPNFREAFQKLLHRTDALRTVFGETDGIPHQSVRPEVAFTLDILDFSAEREDVGVQSGPVQVWIRQQTQLPMDLSERIFDSALLQLGDARYIWFLKIHHLVTDAVSNALLYKRMQALYQGMQRISGNGLPKGPGETEAVPSFLDYVSHEHQEREHSRNEASHAYWREKTIHPPDVPKFYGNTVTGKTTEAPRVSLKLDNKRLTKLRQLAQRPDIRSWTEDLTVFNLFMTAYAVFLHRVSGVSSLVIGSPAHNRGERQFQDTVGLLIEVLPILGEIEENDSFKTLLQRIKRETNAYLRHALPGAATAEVGRSFNALLNYIHADFPDFNGFPTRTEWVHTGHVDSAHAIRCHIYQFNGEDALEIAFDLNREVFSKETAQRVPKHFLRVLDALLEDIESPIGKVSLITPQEKQTLLRGAGAHSNLPSPDPVSLPSPDPTSSAGHADSPPPPRSIVMDFEGQASRRPNAVALECGGEILTYGHLDRQADRLAQHLKKRGIGATHTVALYLYRGTEYIIGVLAVMKAGAAFIPIASDQPSERIGHILSDSGCSLVLTEESLAKNIGSCPHLIVSQILSPKNPSDSLTKSDASQPAPYPDDTAYILYTSGSTGRPKGVVISHKALSNYMHWAATHYGVDESSVFPLFTSIGFDLTLTSTLLPLGNGGRVIVYPEKREGLDMSLLQVLEDPRPNIIKLTPSHLALLQGRDFSTSPIKTMIVGGEDLKVYLAKSIATIFPEDLKIYNEYGPTEATIGCIVSQYDKDGHTGTSVPIGRPIANMYAFVLDVHKNLVPQGVIGELYLGGMGLANGYVNDPEKTAEKFLADPFFAGDRPSSVKIDPFSEGDPSSKGDPFSEGDPSSKGDPSSESAAFGSPTLYRTGDLARINGHGEFEYLGRSDDQVKIRGHRIELADIESNLALHPAVDHCAVVVVHQEQSVPEDEVVHCIRCGLPSNYPDTDFDENGACHLCTAFDTYKEKVEGYFKNNDELVRLLTSNRGAYPGVLNNKAVVHPKQGPAVVDSMHEPAVVNSQQNPVVVNSEQNPAAAHPRQNPKYDCISLLSGGKDSTYVLARLVDMGLNVLAFTLDNGYISDQAKVNIDRIVRQLGVDHVYGETPHMNAIFVDSLKRHHNICNGCFKTIYTLSTQIALDKGIPFIVTGLSRGQFFETRLTEELFWEDTTATKKIDDTILEARKLYHREPDAVRDLLDVSAFEDDTLFEKVQFVDFYRYSDVSLEDMLAFLDEKIGWIRPTDTGRSTNCLINQVGIYVHKQEKGYSNYAYPYSWDVRLGHKKRQESLAEINETIDDNEVHRIMEEIGYDRSEKDGPQNEKLVAYFTGNSNLPVKELKDFLAQKLPPHMIPLVFKHLEALPLTRNAKVDKNGLQHLNSVQLSMDSPYEAPRNDIEELLEGIWKEVLQLKKVGVHDDFIALGGHSLAAIRVTARLNGELETDFPLNTIFEHPSIAEYAKYIAQTLTAIMEN